MFKVHQDYKSYTVVFKNRKTTITHIETPVTTVRLSSQVGSVSPSVGLVDRLLINSRKGI